MSSARAWMVGDEGNIGVRPAEHVSHSTDAAVTAREDVVISSPRKKPRQFPVKLLLRSPQHLVVAVLGVEKAILRPAGLSRSGGQTAQSVRFGLSGRRSFFAPCCLTPEWLRNSSERRKHFDEPRSIWQGSISERPGRVIVCEDEPGLNGLEEADGRWPMSEAIAIGRKWCRQPADGDVKISPSGKAVPVARVQRSGSTVASAHGADACCGMIRLTRRAEITPEVVDVA
ncbi:hypothetical protein BC827DRAFT_1157530 [Russula dissimulans]|nr:hypothetical protein BC827DRAFT_1157530 [Russula dissimulans]